MASLDITIQIIHFGTGSSICLLRIWNDFQSTPLYYERVPQRNRDVEIWNVDTIPCPSVCSLDSNNRIWWRSLLPLEVLYQEIWIMRQSVRDDRCVSTFFAIFSFLKVHVIFRRRVCHICSRRFCDSVDISWWVLKTSMSLFGVIVVALFVIIALRALGHDV